MELCGRNPAWNGSFSGHHPEWSPAGPETGGLEEPMWQLSLRGSESYPERPGVPDCVYYMRTGFCGYGNRCNYNHPRNRAAVEAAVIATGEYPERPGEPSCQAPVIPVLSPGEQPPVGATSLYGLTQLSSSTPSLAGPYPSLPSSTCPSSSNQKEQTFPERPSEPECQYYLRTGDCKFGSSCRYHHPRDRVVPQTNCALNPMGLPLPSPCAFYFQNGHCKFGSTCKFDHQMGTMRYSPSASSLIDIPVAPYPVGSLLATLAPFSSSESQPELISGSKKGSYLS